MPTQLVIGAGVGATLTTIVSLALQGISPNESGVASALTNAMGGIGGAVGVSVLNMVAVVVSDALPNPHSDHALNTGYVVAFLGATVLFVLALLFVLLGRARSSGRL